MKKVFITERTNIHERMLLGHPEIEMTNNPVEADFLISQSTCMYPEFAHKTIYIGIEAPRTDHRIWCYSNFDKFHTVVCHNPDPSKPNQIPLTPDDSAQFYPVYSDPYPYHTRSDTTMKNRGVFYAGMINIFENSPDACGGINITPLRKTLGNYFQTTEPFKQDSKIIGIGWNGQGSKVGNWREDKHKLIMESNCDFVLAMENTMYPNYLYEKIWDGFACDRVTLYLGDPRIEHHIPLNCFVDLRPYFNLQTKEFDTEALGKRLREMTQEEYDEILKNMRVFRETGHGKYRHYMDLLTQRIIDIILK